MIVRDIFLDGFRNYTGVTARFSDGVNVISGKNAQGKTNLLEAVHYLAIGRSFRVSTDKDLISFDKDSACIRANIISGGREQVLQVRIFRARRREMFANGVKLKNASELSAKLTTVFFGPDDLNIVKDGAAVRRKLMDQSMSQLRPGYLAALTEFNRVYEHKTRILKGYREKPSLLELLDDFNLHLAQQSAKLIYYRCAFSKILARKAAVIHNEFSGGEEKLEIVYKTVGGMDPNGKTVENILPEVLKRQSELSQAEIRSGMCLVGAHKDDLYVEINGAAARKFASQGQLRTASVSIKLAERDVHYDDRGEYPILLLDDVLSELDKTRQAYVLERIRNGQVFITCCDESSADNVLSGTTLRVNNGIIGEI